MGRRRRALGEPAPPDSAGAPLPPLPYDDLTVSERNRVVIGALSDDPEQLRLAHAYNAARRQRTQPLPEETRP